MQCFGRSYSPDFGTLGPLTMQVVSWNFQIARNHPLLPFFPPVGILTFTCSFLTFPTAAPVLIFKKKRFPHSSPPGKQFYIDERNKTAKKNQRHLPALAFLYRVLFEEGTLVKNTR